MHRTICTAGSSLLNRHSASSERCSGVHVDPQMGVDILVNTDGSLVDLAEPLNQQEGVVT